MAEDRVRRAVSDKPIPAPGQPAPVAVMGRGDIEQIEFDLLLEAIWRRYGYDFRAYARATIERRTLQFLSGTGFATIAELIPKVLHDADFFSRLARQFSIPVTEMFRDPLVYRSLRENVVPLLRTWPHIKIWHAGCASGEEAYSMAILFKEEGLFERTTLYATDFNDEVLELAREGIYDLDKLKEAIRNYQAAGGTASLSDYFHAAYNAAAMDASLRERIVFSNHNLMADGVFGEMHLIVCRNVLIYFNRELQNRALGLFTDSLVHGGFLCIGTKEDLQFSSVAEHYEVLDCKARIYRKRTP